MSYRQTIISHHKVDGRDVVLTQEITASGDSDESIGVHRNAVANARQHANMTSIGTPDVTNVERVEPVVPKVETTSGLKQFTSGADCQAFFSGDLGIPFAEKL